MNVYISGFVPNDYQIPEVVKDYLVSHYRFPGINLLVSCRCNLSKKLEDIELQENDKAPWNTLRVSFLGLRTIGATEYDNANDAGLFKGEQALIFWDMKDVFTIQEVLLLLDRSVLVTLYNICSRSFIEIKSINDLLDILPPRKDGTIPYGEGLVNKVESADGYTVEKRRQIYEEVVAQTDIVRDLVELSAKGSFNMQTLSTTAWFKLYEIEEAIRGLDLKQDELLQVFDERNTINLILFSKEDLYRFLEDHDMRRVIVRRFVASNLKCISEALRFGSTVYRSPDSVMILDTTYYFDKNMLYDFEKNTFSSNVNIDKKNL